MVDRVRSLAEWSFRLAASRTDAERVAAVRQLVVEEGWPLPDAVREVARRFADEDYALAQLEVDG
jgi:hypothetical protein